MVKIKRLTAHHQVNSIRTLDIYFLGVMYEVITFHIYLHNGTQFLIRKKGHDRRLSKVNCKVSALAKSFSPVHSHLFVPELPNEISG